MRQHAIQSHTLVKINENLHRLCLRLSLMKPACEKGDGGGALWQSGQEQGLKSQTAQGLNSGSTNYQLWDLGENALMVLST